MARSRSSTSPITTVAHRPLEQRHARAQQDGSRIAATAICPSAIPHSLPSHGARISSGSWLSPNKFAHWPNLAARPKEARYGPCCPSRRQSGQAPILLPSQTSRSRGRASAGRTSPIPRSSLRFGCHATSSRTTEGNSRLYKPGSRLLCSFLYQA